MSDTTAHLVNIDGAWIAGISRYSCSLEDIDNEDSQRNENFRMVRSVGRKKVKKLSLTFKVTQEQLAFVCDAIKEDTVTMTVLCPADTEAVDGYSTADFYVSKVDFNLLKLGEKSWYEMSFNAIEV